MSSFPLATESLDMQSDAPAAQLSRSTSPSSLLERTRLARQQSINTAIRSEKAIGTNPFPTGGSADKRNEYFWSQLWLFRKLRREWFTPSQQVRLQEDVTAARSSYEAMINDAEQSACPPLHEIDEPGCLLCMERVVRLRLLLEQYLSELILHRMRMSRFEQTGDASIQIPPVPRLSIRALPPRKVTSDYHSTAWWYCAERHYTGGYDTGTRTRNFKRERWNKWRDFRK